MLAVKAIYDGKRVVLPEDVAAQLPVGEVIVVFGTPHVASDEVADWRRAQESSFAGAWDNDADAVYDTL